MMKWIFFVFAVLVNHAIADDQPTPEQINAFVSRLTPQQQSSAIVAMRNRIAESAKHARTEKEKEALAAERKSLADAVAKNVPLFPVMDSKPTHGDIGLIRGLVPRLIMPSGDVISDISISDGDPLAIPGHPMSLDGAWRSANRAAANSHLQPVTIVGLNTEKLVPGDPIATDDLFFVTSSKKELTFRKIDKADIADAWQKAFQRK